MTIPNFKKASDVSLLDTGADVFASFRLDKVAMTIEHQTGGYPDAICMGEECKHRPRFHVTIVSGDEGWHGYGCFEHSPPLVTDVASWVAQIGGPAVRTLEDAIRTVMQVKKETYQ